MLLQIIHLSIKQFINLNKLLNIIFKWLQTNLVLKSLKFIAKDTCTEFQRNALNYIVCNLKKISYTRVIDCVLKCINILAL